MSTLSHPTATLPAPSESERGRALADAAAPPQRTPVRRGARALRHLASEVGQGTVEYVGLLLLMATLLAAVVAGAKGLGGQDKIGKQVVNQIGQSIEKAGGGGNER